FQASVNAADAARTLSLFVPSKTTGGADNTARAIATIGGLTFTEKKPGSFPQAYTVTVAPAASQIDIWIANQQVAKVVVNKAAFTITILYGPSRVATSSWADLAAAIMLNSKDVSALFTVTGTTAKTIAPTTGTINLISNAQAASVTLQFPGVNN